MDHLLAAALVGTARQPDAPRASGTPADPLIASLDTAPERAILLAAGAAAVCRQAGLHPRPATTPPAPCPAETLGLPTSRATILLEELFAGHPLVLPEALALMARAQKRLPPALLVTALDTAKPRGQADLPTLRATVPPVLGARGHWLAAHNPAWRWVEELAPDMDLADPARAEAIWQEGRPQQRVALIMQMHGTNPIQARAWLSAAWKQEKADLRHDLLGALAANLSPDDEPFLESALDDRSEKVRTKAATLLSRLPRSALSCRMRARAEAMLAYEPEGSGGMLARITRALQNTSGHGDLMITLPDDLEAGWLHDGVVATPPSAAREIGGRGWWMQQVIGLVPPSHWTERFACAPGALIDAAGRTEWSAQIIEAWSRAALLHRDSAWAGPLWDWWLDAAGRAAGGQGAIQGQMLQSLPALLTPVEAERRLQPLVGGNARFGQPANLHEQIWRTMIAVLPIPWSTAFSAACLEGLHRFIASGPDGQTLTASLWFHHLDAVARGITPTRIPAELALWQTPDLAAELPDRQIRRDWVAQRWAETLARFVETLRLRRRIYHDLADG